ncbi:MAG: tetratricopeptide repeat protein [Pseudomonadales bacterium]|nr:tetratricopeptide repeat protein [Pseudomonadales bacterium]MCP5329904.1 tetratricopeptide repeat protein [Pseudomonadales bacterium]MCP5343167.1 tetratricopeptide repeat protein [Pseudomonadales bacterium]
MNYPDASVAVPKGGRRLRLSLSICLALGVCSLPVTAQDAQSIPAAPLQQAQELLSSGAYVAAIDLFQRVDGFEEEEALLGMSRAYALTGQYEQGIALLEEAISDYAASAALSTQLAELLRMTGQSARALSILQDVVAGNTTPPVRSLVQYGSLLQFVGRREEAIGPLSAAISRYDSGLVFDSGDIAMVALASWLLDRFHDANSLFSEATRIDPQNMEAQALWGDLFMEKFNVPDAEQSYNAALDVNRRYGPALIGQARISGGERSLNYALNVNPRDVRALETMAELLVLNDRQEEAQQYLDQALEINPEALKALSLKAAQAALKEDFASFARIEAQLNAFSPDNPLFYGEIADAFGNNYRFTEAVGYARQAIAADPAYWQGHTLLGTNLIRLGEEEAGRAALELAFDNDPFNVQTSNMLKVFDTLDEYATLRTEHFEVRMSQDDAVVLWPYMAPLIEENWATLTAKYGFEPEGPILIEVFERTEDFAVRSVGLPDIGPLVGICFGKVVTLISPGTLDANWQEILWHELVHVFTLQLTQNRMPRWLSEGISVWEEHEARPEWGRRQGIELVRAAQAEKLLPVSSLNEGFTGANSNEDLGFAYFQSYLVVDFIAREHGFDKLLELIKQYALIKEESEMFSTVFGKPIEEFDADFQRWIERRVEEINVYVHSEDSPDEGEAHGHGQRENSSAVLAELYNNASLKQHMMQRVQDQPRDFQAHLQLGIVLFKEENFADAKVHLEIAHELLPDYSGYPSPPLVLSQIYERMGDEEARFAQLKIMMENHQHDYDSAVVLARRALEQGNNEEARYYVERAISVSPYRLGVHQVGAELAGLIHDTGMAVREYEVLVNLDRNDPVEARTNLAEAYINNGQPEQARRNILTALEIAPSYLRAQRVLLQAVDGQP